MKNIIVSLSVAFLVALLIHYLFFVIIDKQLKNSLLFSPTSSKKPQVKKKGFTNIKFVSIKKPQPKTKPIKEISKESKKIVKQTNKPKINEQVKKILKSQEINKVVKKEKTVKKSVVKNKTPDLKSLFTLSKEEQEKQKEFQKNLADNQNLKQINQEDDSLHQLDPLTQSYIRLYGEQYFKFTDEQKRYLKNNLSKIGMITQRYLEYPHISLRTGQSGVNVVEFYLHPNGDISELKLLDNSGYTALDTNSIETIEVAYKDYPRPKEITKIKIYVKYILN